MTTFVKLECLCGLNKFNLAFATAELPVKTGICHCSACRHSTGQSCACYVPTQGEPLSIDDTDEQRTPAKLNGLTPYQSSSNSTRYFCSRCSAHMFFRTKDEKQDLWEAAVGLLGSFDGIVEVTSHIWVGDTLDGCVAKHLPTLGGEKLPLYKESSRNSEILPSDWNSPRKPLAKYILHFHCHCNSVNFYLKRSTEIKDLKQEWWHVAGESPSVPIRFAQEHCLCNSCRRSSGGLFQTWVFIPTSAVFADPDCNVAVDLTDPEKRLPGLHQYQSSPDVRRESCGTCGACVFYWIPGRSRMDVTSGLVDQDEAGSVLPEAWFGWGESKLGYPEGSISKDLAGALEKGMRSCGIPF